MLFLFFNKKHFYYKYDIKKLCIDIHEKSLRTKLGIFLCMFMQFFCLVWEGMSPKFIKKEHMFEKVLTTGFDSIIIQLSTKQNICSKMKKE